MRPRRHHGGAGALVSDLEPGEAAMQRTVTMPADLGGEALDELKGWLGISRPHEDRLLIDLLGVSAGMCEAFTGQMPIEATVEETIPAGKGSRSLATRPVRALVAVEWVGADLVRTSLETGQYQFAVDAGGLGCITIDSVPQAVSVAVRFRAGIAADWRALPEPLRQGMIRLAAFHYHDRGTGRDAAPPASIAALWRPWRIMRLA
jgi:uncharacterized phiE125 gp8 family phage protein